MLEIHPKLLWLGNALHARDPRAILDAEIQAVVDVALEEPAANLPRRLIYCRIPLNDGPGNDPNLLMQTIQITSDLLMSRIPTLLACSAGMSRSPTIAAFALAAVLSEEPESVILRISKAKQLDVSPVLWHDVADVFSRVKVRT